jgi:thiol-disulfide isomerase/thioredoxin
MSGGSGSIRNGPELAMYRWRMDPNVLPAQKVAQIGIEAVTPEAHRLAAREAQQRAKNANLEVLSWPEPGEAYSFTLTTVDGQKVRSAELKGKVVLIDCWATWCSPCMALMPELKALYAKWHGRGLEIIGISLDRDVETMRKTCKSQDLTWPQVYVPEDERIRELWHEASGIRSIPRLLLMDRDGILHDPSGRLEEEVAKLLTRSPEKAPAKPKP